VVSILDNQTYSYYQNHADEIFERYESPTNGISQFFSISFPDACKVLDIGAGSGRDMKKLSDQGYDITGIEPSQKLRDLAIRKYTELSGKLLDGQLPDLDDSFNNQFDGILCSAVLMHIPKEQLFDTAFSLKRVLKPRGNLLLSIPGEGPETDHHFRDKNGRLYQQYNPEYLQLLLERIGFQLTGKWETEDSLGRKNRTWIVLLFHLAYASGTRPLEQLESILNRDRKVATYKLALIRALCEISIANYNQVIWERGGSVRVPVKLIAEKWLYYYWPLIENHLFLPQIYGEREEGGIRIAFRKSMEELTKQYCKKGGLSGFTLDLRSTSFDSETNKLVRHVFNKIKRTIITGPVTYAGSSIETGRMFEYVKKDRTIRFPASIWRELSLMNHWIKDAIILRWAELTSEISKKAIKPSEVIDLLLSEPLEERDVYDIRGFYQKEKNKECVWTGQTLKMDFDIDHVIPFSLWRNNDLWNLLPCSSRINREKRDMLPSRNLIVKRKDSIITCWRLNKSFNKKRFFYEINRLLAEPMNNNSWEIALFDYLKESVEITALQRRVPRWEPHTQDCIKQRMKKYQYLRYYFND
jgi:2-polyprenyl-3-methyl-5-hydroxy-6-metoxy-1,4-benzoquinol methylase